MSESSQPSGRYVPATPEPSPQNPDVVSNDITVNRSKSTWMRLHVPTSALNGPKKLPLVVYYHHGEFTTGSVNFNLNHTFCNDMALELNVVVASPSYQLAPEHPLPAAYDDGVAALEWIKDSSSDDEWIKSYADLSNVYLMGSRSGGNVAYNVGVRVSNVGLAPLRIRGLILHQPFFGHRERYESEYMVDLTPSHYWENCLPVGANWDHEYWNPTARAGPTMMEVIRQSGCKVLVSGREGDLMVDRQRRMAKLMKEKGVDVVERFTDANVPEFDDLFDCITSFIHSTAPF